MVPGEGARGVRDSHAVGHTRVRKEIEERGVTGDAKGTRRRRPSRTAALRRGSARLRVRSGDKTLSARGSWIFWSSGLPIARARARRGRARARGRRVASRRARAPPAPRALPRDRAPRRATPRAAARRARPPGREAAGTERRGAALGGRRLYSSCWWPVPSEKASSGMCVSYALTSSPLACCTRARIGRSGESSASSALASRWRTRRICSAMST